MLASNDDMLILGMYHFEERTYMVSLRKGKTFCRGWIKLMGFIKQNVAVDTVNAYIRRVVGRASYS